MAFIYGHSIFKYPVILPGLTNAPAVFQYLMNCIFTDFLNDFLIVYLEDLLVYSAFKLEHLAHPWTVFEHLLAH